MLKIFIIAACISLYACAVLLILAFLRAASSNDPEIWEESDDTEQAENNKNIMQ